MIPINLAYFNVPSLIIKVKETSLPDIRLENIDTKNPGWSVRNEQTDPG